MGFDNYAIILSAFIPFIKNEAPALAGEAQLDGASSHAQRVVILILSQGTYPECGFHLTPRVHVGGNRLMFYSHIDVSFSLRAQTGYDHYNMENMKH